jgi:hypothetical protein
VNNADVLVSRKRFAPPRRREHWIQGAHVTELPDDLQGTDLLAQEIKDEAGRLVHHPIAEVKRLEHVVEEGDSSATPLILTVAVTAGIALIVAVVLTLVFVAYYTA